MSRTGLYILSFHATHSSIPSAETSMDVSTRRPV